MAEAIQTESAPKPIAPYVQGMDGGSHVYVSGQLGVDPANGEIPADFEAEVRRVMSNIEAVVEAAGMTMGDVVKTTIFVKDFEGYAVMNEVYAEFFGATPPARSTVAVADLLAGARIEIEAIAMRGS